MHRGFVYFRRPAGQSGRRVFSALRWGWVEGDWENREVAHISLPKEFRPTTRGSRKFEPIAFIGKRSIDILKKWREYQQSNGQSTGENDKIFPLTPGWVRVTFHRIYLRAIRDKALRPSKADEQLVTAKSSRKFVFNAIDACQDVSPEWRNMLKGRSLKVEQYYSAENIEALRKIYLEKIQPMLGTSSITKQAKKIQELEEEVGLLRDVIMGRVKLSEKARLLVDDVDITDRVPKMTSEETTRLDAKRKAK